VSAVAGHVAVRVVKQIRGAPSRELIIRIVRRCLQRWESRSVRSCRRPRSVARSGRMRTPDCRGSLCRENTLRQSVARHCPISGDGLHDRCRRQTIPGNPPTSAYIKDQPSWPISVSNCIYETYDLGNSRLEAKCLLQHCRGRFPHRFAACSSFDKTSCISESAAASPFARSAVI
jgi:hypothetical protein